MGGVASGPLGTFNVVSGPFGTWAMLRADRSQHRRTLRVGAGRAAPGTREAGSTCRNPSTTRTDNKIIGGFRFSAVKASFTAWRMKRTRLSQHPARAAGLASPNHSAASSASKINGGSG
jgi:hypothetical protein